MECQFNRKDGFIELFQTSILHFFKNDDMHRLQTYDSYSYSSIMLDYFKPLLMSSVLRSVFSLHGMLIDGKKDFFSLSSSSPGPCL